MTDAQTLSPEIEALAQELFKKLAVHLNAIKDFFVPEAEITLVVRIPGIPDNDADVVMSSERNGYAPVIKLLERTPIASIHLGDTGVTQ